MKTNPDIKNTTANTLSNIKFSDVFAIEDIQRFQDLFSDASGVASIITHPDGTPITKPSNFCRLCNDIIRKTEKGRSNCFHSDAIIGGYNPTGAIIWPCLSGGLWDAGASISVGGKHMANWLIGQLRNEVLDEQHMIQYAEEIGANIEDFKEALNEVPVISILQFKKVAKMLFAFANELSEKAYNNLLQKIQITELKQVQETLTRDQYLMNALMNNLPDCIYFKDKESRFIRINEAHAQLFGLNKPDEEIGKTDFDFFTEEHARQAFEDEQAIIQSGKPLIKEEKNTWKDRSDTWVSTIKLPLVDHEGNIVGTFGISRDITEQKLVSEELIKAKEHAEESDRLKSAFLANMSHEIRTPMNGILGFADLLTEQELTCDEQQEYINIIKKSGERLLNIINDLIDISKVESGQMEIFISETNVNEQIEYIHTFFKPEVEKKGMKIFFRCGLPVKEVVIKTDREKIYAILTNLIKNAIKYSDKGTIEIGYNIKRASTTGSTDSTTEPPVSVKNELEFFIMDTGIGIPQNKKETIFDRFVQVDLNNKRAVQGAGLGLAISKAYVEMLGGKIWVESELGKGSTFYFTIPYKNKPE